MKTEMSVAREYPKIGDIRRGADLGFKESRPYIYVACPDCGVGKWMMRNRYERGLYPRCRACGCKSSAHLRRGNRNYNWKGGRKKTTGGYIEVYLNPGDRLYEMANSHGYVLEHRLVMAQHLGRPLLKSEIVHHRPDVAKDDNRIEVLYLMPNQGTHSKLSPCSNCELKKEIRLLRWQIKEQMEQIRNLTTQLMLAGGNKVA